MKRRAHLALSITNPISSELRGIAEEAARMAVNLLFTEWNRMIARADAYMIGLIWTAVSATTRPVLAGPGWQAELRTMGLLAATVALPLLAAAAILSIVRQDPSGLVRAALIRLPLALVFTGAAVELVALGLAAVDQASAALIASTGGSLHDFFRGVNEALLGANPINLAVNVFLLVAAGVLAFAVWLELAVRAAAVAVATLFLPLALIGSTFPGTAHWGRRLAETLAALVLSKLVIVAVLALAVATLGGGRGGLSALVEAIALLAVSAVSPFALLRILPMVESGAIAHLDGTSRQVTRAVDSKREMPDWISRNVDKAKEEVGNRIESWRSGRGAGGTSHLDTSGRAGREPGDARETRPVSIQPLLDSSPSPGESQPGGRQATPEPGDG